MTMEKKWISEMSEKIPRNKIDPHQSELYLCLYVLLTHRNSVTKYSLSKIVVNSDQCLTRYIKSKADSKKAAYFTSALFGKYTIDYQLAQKALDKISIAK